MSLDQPVYPSIEHIHLIMQTVKVCADEREVRHQLAIVSTEKVLGQQISDLSVPLIACAKHGEGIAADTGGVHPIAVHAQKEKMIYAEMPRKDIRQTFHHHFRRYIIE